MRLTSDDPVERGRIEARLIEIKRNGFEPVEAKDYPGHYFRTRCVKCGHELRINQMIWRMRHSLKCEG